MEAATEGLYAKTVCGSRSEGRYNASAPKVALTNECYERKTFRKAFATKTHNQNHEHCDHY